MFASRERMALAVSGALRWAVAGSRTAGRRRASLLEIVSPLLNFWTAQGALGNNDWKRRSEPTKARAVSASILSGKAAALPMAGAAPAARCSGALLCPGTGCKAGLQDFGRNGQPFAQPIKRFLVGNGTGSSASAYVRIISISDGAIPVFAGGPFLLVCLTDAS